MRRCLLPLLATLLACAPKQPRSLADVAAKLDYAETPHLAAPTSGAYAAGEEAPQDPVLRTLLRGKHVDGSLSAAAGGLALAAAARVGGVARWELREALWRGGWPYPADEARSWTLGSGKPPSRDLITWVESTPETTPMALARARGDDMDVWVGIRAQPEVDLGALPRLATLGTTLALPPIAGATYRLTDQEGVLHEGPLDRGASAILSGAGEWLVELRKDGRDVARFPVYVGIDGPAAPLLRLPEPPPSVVDADDVEALAVDLLDHVRTTYGRTPWKRSPVFDSAVTRYVADPSIGSAGALRSLGFPKAEAIVWACDDATVENCLDTWVWDPRRRAVLLTDRMDSYGLHATLDSRGVHLTLLLVDAE